MNEPRGSREVKVDLGRVLACVAAVCIVGLTAMVLAVPGDYAGPVVLSLGDRGLHLYDVPALVFMAAGLAACAGQAFARRTDR